MAGQTVEVCVHEQINPQGLERLRNVKGIYITTVDYDPDGDDWELPVDTVGKIEVLFSGKAPSNLDAAKSLKLLQISSAGYNHLLGLDLPERGIRACNAAGVFDLPIAEWNIAMMINLARDLRGMVRHQEHGIWDRSPRFQREISKSVVGFWGYGGLARETARLCKALDMTVHVLARSGVKTRDETYVVPGHGDPDGKLPDKVFTPDQKKEFLGGLDFLIIAVPLTGQTRGMIGEEELHMLKPTACLLNPARGAIIQEEALVKALREQWLAAAALDTHYYYPMPADHPLWRFPNVIMTPHISGSSQTQTFGGRVWDIFVQNVERYVAGQNLLNVLTPKQLMEK